MVAFGSQKDDTYNITVRVKNVPVKLLGTGFEARNCISEPGPQKPYWEIF
jgi:hypothetical protein